MRGEGVVRSLVKMRSTTIKKARKIYERLDIGRRKTAGEDR